MELPWLVIHGATAFRAALGVAALGGLLLAWFAPRLLAARDARRARARLGAPVPADALEEGAIVTLAGRLEADGAPCERFEDGGEAAAATVAYAAGVLRAPVDGGPWIAAVLSRSEKLAVVSGETAFELAGDVEVVAGSREARPGPMARQDAAIRARAAGGSQRAVPAYARRPSALRSLGAGDPVRVRGTLRRELAERPGHYRQTRTRWTLVPVPGEEAIAVAFDELPALRRPAPWQLARGAGAGALLFLAGSTAVGELSWRVAGALGSADRDAGAALLAVASPLHRDRALGARSTALEQRCSGGCTQADVDEAAALSRLRDDCAGEARLLMRHGLLARAAEAGERCGAFHAAAEASYLRGRFAEASADLERARAAGEAPVPGDHASGDRAQLDEALFAARTHLFARRAELAAESVTRARLLALSFQMAGRVERTRARLGCLIEAGDRPGSASTPACRKLFGTSREIAAACDPSDLSDDVGWAVCLDARLAEGDQALLADRCATPRHEDPPALVHPSKLFGELDASPAIGPPAVLRKIVERITARHGDERCALRGQIAASLAAFESLSGAHREARALALEAEADFAGDAGRGERILALRAAIELEAGGFAEARALLNRLEPGAADVRELGFIAGVRERGELALISAPQEYFGTMLHAPRPTEPWSITSEADGARLATWLAHHDGEGAAYLVSTPPSLPRGTSELLAWFRWGDKRACSGCAPWNLLFEAERRQASVEALGDEILAGELRSARDAFHAALGAREVAVAIAVLDDP